MVKAPVGLMAVGKIYVKQMSVGQIFEILLDKCLLGTCMLFVSSQMSVSQTLLSQKGRMPKCLSAKWLLNKCMLAAYLFIKCLPTKCLPALLL
jgi:hypothetical protein